VNALKDITYAHATIELDAHQALDKSIPDRVVEIPRTLSRTGVAMPSAAYILAGHAEFSLAGQRKS
jgi:hypothetical protein